MFLFFKIKSTDFLIESIFITWKLHERSFGRCRMITVINVAFGSILSYSKG